MSAAEKLRALEPEGIVQTEASGQGYLDRVLLTGEAFAAIIAVVEAAEQLAAWWPAETHGEISGEQFDATRAALTALSQALEPGDVT